MPRTVIAAALGECVHVAGINNFLRLAESAGWKTIFLGPAVPIDQVLACAIDNHAELVGVSYRLTPETGERLLGDFAEAADPLRTNGTRFIFGGTPPIAERARKMGFFDHVFEGGESTDEVLAYLDGQNGKQNSRIQSPQTTIERLRWKKPYPLIRHHFGLPTMRKTIQGIEQIADAAVLDVISLGIDQDAQENFFHPEKQDPRRKGAGGVPVRTPEEYTMLYNASQRGNSPLLRTYSGTDDFIRLAEMVTETIHNAWCAIPLFWFNQMDGRGPWDLRGSIEQHQQVMKWYGERDIPVELNEPHHWGMRDAPDVIFVVSAYLAAYNARAFGVKDYIAQMMFNSPPGHSDAMDLAKMLAVREMIKSLLTDKFHIHIQTRTGLLSYPINESAARAHLAASVYLQMALKPHIVHVVGYSEAHHAATAQDVIESCTLAKRSIENALRGAPDMTADHKIQTRVRTLVQEARITLQAIRNLGKNRSVDPFTDPVTLSEAVTKGIVDAPQLGNNPFAPAKIRTRIINGCCQAVDENGNWLPETNRLRLLL